MTGAAGPIRYGEARDLSLDQVLALYRANKWSAAAKGELLLKALVGSHSLVSAWDGDRLVGLGNAITDGHLVVYYPHMLVHPDYQGRGIGRAILERLQARYPGFHQQMLIAEPGAAAFYERCGFKRAGATTPMWIYAGGDG